MCSLQDTPTKCIYFSMFVKSLNLSTDWMGDIVQIFTWLPKISIELLLNWQYSHWFLRWQCTCLTCQTKSSLDPINGHWSQRYVPSFNSSKSLIFDLVLDFLVRFIGSPVAGSILLANSCLFQVKLVSLPLISNYIWWIFNLAPLVLVIHATYL